MNNNLQSSALRGWLAFGLRWLVLLALGWLLSTQRTDATALSPVWATGLVIGVSAQALLLVCLLVPMLHVGAPAIALLGDIAMAAAFAYLGSDNVWTLIAAAALPILSGLVQADGRWIALQVVGVVGAVYLAASYQQPGGLPENALPFILLVGAAALLVGFGLDRYVGSLRRGLDAASRERAAQDREMHQRTRAMYELAYTMSAKPKYERVLETALEAGRLALTMPERDLQGLVACVLLFHYEDNKLHVVASRRLTRSDEQMIIDGTNGIVGTALSECVPMIGVNAMKDPELQYFVAFQICRSVLCIPLRAGYENFGVLLYGSERPNAFNSEHIELMTAIGVQATIALQNAVLYQNLQDEKERIVEAEEDARKKLARDLHDGPTQSVAAIAMRVSYIQKLITKRPDEVPDELTKVEELARKTTKEIRHMLFTLRPLVLETQGLNAALHQLAEKMKETHSQNVAVRVGRDVESLLDRHQQGVLFYIAEEAVNNARKHAQAMLISVSITRQDDVVIAQIADNGVGFNLNSVDADYHKRSSLGMVNMRERAALLNATLSIDSEEGRGTVITIVVPLHRGGQYIMRDSTARMRPVQPLTRLAMAASHADRVNGSERR